MTSQEYLLLNNIAHQMRNDIVLKTYVSNIQSQSPGSLMREVLFDSLYNHVRSKYSQFFLIISKYK